MTAPSALVTLLLSLAAAVHATEPFFYDGDGASCSLGCACGWTVTQPTDARMLGQETPRDEEGRVADASKCISLTPGSEIAFTLGDVASGTVPFRGFNVCGGSWDGQQDCTLPRRYAVIVNRTPVGSGILRRTRDPQFIAVGDVTVRDGDVLRIRFVDGYREGKRIGVTWLIPSGAH